MVNLFSSLISEFFVFTLDEYRPTRILGSKTLVWIQLF